MKGQKLYATTLLLGIVALDSVDFCGGVWHVFQLQTQVQELVASLLVHFFLDFLLLDLGLGASRGGWLADFLHTQVLLRLKPILCLGGLRSDLIINFLSDLSLLCLASLVNKALDLGVELRAVVVDELDEAHVIVQFQLYVLQDLNRRLGFKSLSFFQVIVNPLDVDSQLGHDGVYVRLFLL